MTSILVVEDDEAIRTACRRGLTERGYAVATAATGMLGLEQLLAVPPQVVLLDLGLPDVDGLALITMIRAASRVPIIVITAQDDDPTMVKALDSGADDYVVKPFGFRELVARIRAVLRRGARVPAADGRQDLGTLTIDRRGRQVLLAGHPVDLTTKEFDLLALLAEEPGTVRRREEIIARVWDENWWGSTKTLDVHVASLRKKLGDPRWIATLRGVGYRLDVPS
jgi:DNA-binding response OmpR family regulator